MKKIIICSTLALLTGCTNPDVMKPYGYNSPTYYKVPECKLVQDYPHSFRKVDPTTGFIDTYRTTHNVYHTECNYNVLQYGMYGTPSLSQVVYGTR